MLQSGGFFGGLLGPLLKTGLALIQALAKSVLVPLELRTAASPAEARIHERNIRLRNNNTNNIK